ncbi:MAG: DUF5362 domain-containing protein [Candidatus Eisenbacteria bacterium]|nr:DUF5362 domain-containing protein [Candidatus Eisenbacteria bacterium]
MLEGEAMNEQENHPFDPSGQTPGSPPVTPPVSPPVSPPLTPPDHAGMPASPPAVNRMDIPVPPMDWFSRFLIPVQESRGWLKFLGVVFIASGILTALTIFGLLFAWVYIWAGVLLWQAGNRAEQAALRRDPSELERYLVDMRKIFMIAGIVTAIGLALTALAIILGLALGWMATMMSLFS